MKRSLIRRIVASLVVVGAIVAIGSCTLSGPSDIEIANISSLYTLSHVYITHHSSASWGSDLLAPDVITPGGSASFGVSPGYYDVWVTDTSSVPAYTYDVHVHSGDTVTLYYDGTTLQ